MGNEELQRMGMKMHVINRELREQISAITPEVPDPKYTKDANEKTKLALRYTR